MKIFSLKKYDNFIISTFKSRKVQYFFMKLPLRAIAIGLIALCLSTKLVSIAFVIGLLVIFYLISKPKLKQI